MRTSGFKVLTTLVVGLGALPATAWAQAPAPAPAAPPAQTPPAATPPAAAQTPVTTPAPAPAEAPAPAPPAAPEPAPAPADAAAPPPAPPPPPDAPPPAEAPKPSTLITGFFEGAYHRSLNDPGGNTVPLHAYDYNANNTFMVHAAHLQVKHSLTEHVSGTIVFDAGSDAVANSALYGGSLFDVQEAYGQYMNSGFTVTAGKFVTYEGIEVVQGPSNPTITRGFLYTLAEPVTHVGFKAHYATGPLDVGVGLVNGWDRLVDNNNAKTVIGRIGVTPVKQFWAAVSGSYGAEVTDDNPRLSLDLTGAVIPSDMIAINFQANYGKEDKAGIPNASGTPSDASWLGFGVQPVLKIDAATIGARFEWFKDDKLSRTAGHINAAEAAKATSPITSASFTNITLTPGYTFDGALTVRAEYRLDLASEKIYFHDGKKNQHTMAIGVHYVF